MSKASKKSQAALTAEKLRELLSYDPETGVFTWLKPKANCMKVGDVAGFHDANGYRQIRVHGPSYMAHRLAYLYVHGVWPPDQVDHINGQRDDNRIANLRLATNVENKRNQKRYRNNSSGFKGVSFHKQMEKWQSNIRIDGKLYYLGLFSCPTAAHLAYCKAAKAHFGEFAREK